MTQRFRYNELAPEGMAALRGLEHYLNTGTAHSAVLLELVRLRCSLLNGCSFCIGLHAAELRKHHEPETRIEAVRDWPASEVFTAREQAALRWADTLTNIQQTHASDADYGAVTEFFRDKDLTDLTLAICSINAWNRLAISSALQWDPRPGRPAAEAAKSDGLASTSSQPGGATQDAVSAIDGDGDKVAQD